MSQYTVRVELHSATYSDYEQLHAAMKSRNFFQVIESSDGTWYHLPTAEYDHTSSGDIKSVTDAVKAAASTTGKQYSVLVTEAIRRRWDNLPEVK